VLKFSRWAINEAWFCRRPDSDYTLSTQLGSPFTGPYITSCGFLSMLARHGKLAGLKRVEIDRTLDWDSITNNSGLNGPSSTASGPQQGVVDCLTSLTGRFKKPSTNESDPQLATARVELTWDEETTPSPKLSSVLGLNPLSLHLSLKAVTDFYSPLLDYSPTTHQYNRIRCIRMDSRHPLDGRFIEGEWSQLVDHLVMVCPSLKEVDVHMELSGNGRCADEEELIRMLNVAATAVKAMVEEVRDDPAKKQQLMKVDVMMELCVVWEGVSRRLGMGLKFRKVKKPLFQSLPLSSHPLFQIGELVSHTDNGIVAEVTRVVDASPAQSIRNVPGAEETESGSSRRVTFTLVRTEHDPEQDPSEADSEAMREVMDDLNDLDVGDYEAYYDDEGNADYEGEDDYEEDEE